MGETGEDHLAPFAVRGLDSESRSHAEHPRVFRHPFLLDRHRIIECAAFRRLEGKTQVFAPSHHDHFRTRLTHTLEAAHIARCLATALGGNELLTEAITLAHDLGHPPFGHAGESALNQIMGNQGGFNHNTHSVRVVTHLEHPFPAFRGLNLTCETLDGLRTHETRYDQPSLPGEAEATKGGKGRRDEGTEGHRKPNRDREGAAAPLNQDVAPPLVGGEPRTAELSPRGSVEARIASVADRVAYNMHDLEDAIGSEFVGLDELSEVALWRDALADSDVGDNPNIHAIRRVVIDAMLDSVLGDVITTSSLQLGGIGSLEEAKTSPLPLVGPTTAMDERLAELEGLLFDRVYRHPKVAQADENGQRKISALFDAYRADPSTLPSRYLKRTDNEGLERVICDYIAGMTDRFCAEEHSQLVRS